MDYCYRLHLMIVLTSAILNSWVLAYTDPLDVMALQDLYKTLDSPSVLEGWKGGDPCKESWTGVQCSGSSVIHLKIEGLNLTGHLGGLLYNLKDLKQLDVSSNKLAGEIPYGFPPNATHVNLALNYLNQTIPHSLTEMKRLRHLNLSHKSLSGFIGNVFTGLDNHHSPPWAFLLDSLPVEQNISHPPTMAIEMGNYPPPKARELKRKRTGFGGLAFMIGVGTILVTGAALIAIPLNQTHANILDSSGSHHRSLQCHSTCGTIGSFRSTNDRFMCSLPLRSTLFLLLILTGLPSASA